MAADNYSPSTSRTAYFPSASNALARLWAREKMLHDFSDLGAAEFFEGPGTDPTALSGYSKSKLWLDVSAGVTTAAGTIRVYAGGTESSLSNWPSVSDFGRGAFASHIGVTGADLDYVWTTSTSGDPGTGKVRANNATLASATSIAISKTGRQGQAYTNRILTWDDATTTGNRGRLSFYDLTDTTVYVEFRVTGTVTDAGTYYTVPVSSVVSGTLVNGRLLGVNFARSGDKGEEGVGAAGIAVAFKETRTAAELTTFAAGISIVHVYGYATAGDRGECTYVVDTVTSTGAFQTPDARWWRPVSVVIRPEMFGAIGDGTTDDTTACQTAVDLAIDRCLAGNTVPKIEVAGYYFLTAPLRCFRLNGGAAFHYITLTVEGNAASGGYVTGRTVGFKTSNGDNPAIILNSGRQCSFKNFVVRGPNGITLPSYAQLVDDSVSPWFNPTGALRDTRYSPCAGIVIDPFKAGGVPADGGYPGMSGYYVENRGSSITTIDGVELSGYIVGIMLSPSGSTQNNDGLSIRKCTFLGNKVPIAIGQDQCRNVNVLENYCLGAQVFCDGGIYGAQTGVMPNISDSLIDYAKFILSFNAGRGPGTLRGCFAESTLSIGCWSGSGYPLNIDECFLKLVRPDSVSIKSVDTVMTNDSPVVFNGGCLTYYNNTPERAFFYNHATIVFNGTMFDGLPAFNKPNLSRINSMPMRYMGLGGSYGVSQEITDLISTVGISTYSAMLSPNGRLREPSINASRELTNEEGWIYNFVETKTVTVGVNGTATFTATDAGAYAVGDYIGSLTAHTLEIAPDVTRSGGGYSPLGRVTSIVGATITLGGCRKSLSTGSQDIYHQRLGTIRRRSTGDIASGSNSITNVTDIATWAVGDWIRGAGIPSGARVTNKSGTTLTISRNATATGAGQKIYDALLQLTGTQRWAVGAPASGVWWQDDELKAVEVGGAQPDANNLIIDRYRCVTSGSPGTWVTLYAKTTSP